jgi:hypothetical protein
MENNNTRVIIIKKNVAQPESHHFVEAGTEASKQIKYRYSFMNFSLSVYKLSE